MPIADLLLPKRPWSMQVELVEGCQRRCMFCGWLKLKKSPKRSSLYQFMDLSLLRDACLDLNTWRPGIRVEINNHGEPTLHPLFHQAVQTIRESIPESSIQVQTNGYRIFPSYTSSLSLGAAGEIHKWFDVGGNTLLVNCYDKGQYDYLMKVLYKEEIRADLRTPDDLNDEFKRYQVVDYFYNNPNNESPYHNRGNKAQIIFVVDGIHKSNNPEEAKRRAAKELINPGGSVNSKVYKKLTGKDPLSSPLKSKCTRVFRELIFNWDLTVEICCYSWLSEFVMGKFPSQSTQEIWESDVWQATRWLLYNRDRNFSPCDKCSYSGGFRQGFLQNPDPEGKFSSEEAHKVVSDHKKMFDCYRLI